MQRGPVPVSTEAAVGVHLTGRRLRTPRAAAIAGIVYAVIMAASYVLILRATPAAATDTGAWIADEGGTVALALSLLPFAGIAFLWFMAVVRDRIGHFEDQFFTTLFIGSGLLYLAMTFLAAALYGSLIALFRLRPELLLEEGLLLSIRLLVQTISTSYMVCMAGMFMLVLGTIWLRTRVMPRWLVLVTYMLALALLVSIEFTKWLTLVFPAWVLLVSLYLLFLDFFPAPKRA